MAEIQQELPGFEPEAEGVGETAAHLRWLQDLGRDVEALAYMMRKPTEGRPFVYEVRFDLIPASSRDATLVAKGFGVDGSVVAFHNAPGFLSLLRGFSHQCKAGKSKWYADQFETSSYQERLIRYRSGEFYKV